MSDKKIAMEHDKKIALVAHDNKKQDLIEWAKYNRTLLAHNRLRWSDPERVPLWQGDC